jgi:hypothetical protein
MLALRTIAQLRCSPRRCRARAVETDQADQHHRAVGSGRCDRPGDRVAAGELEDALGTKIVVINQPAPPARSAR